MNITCVDTILIIEDSASELELIDHYLPTSMNDSQLILGTKIIANNFDNSLGDGYLKFQLNQHTSAVLSIKHTQEVITIPVESVTPMPNMHPCILGLINWRSRIIWIIDLAKMLNLDSRNNKGRQYNVVVIRSESGILGLVVSSIEGTTKFMSDAIQAPSSQLPANLLAYLRGCIYQEDKMSFVLETQVIMESAMNLNNN